MNHLWFVWAVGGTDCYDIVMRPHAMQARKFACHVTPAHSLCVFMCVVLCSNACGNSTLVNLLLFGHFVLSCSYASQLFKPGLSCLVLLMGGYQMESEGRPRILHCSVVCVSRPPPQALNDFKIKWNLGNAL